VITEIAVIVMIAVIAMIDSDVNVESVIADAVISADKCFEIYGSKITTMLVPLR